MILLHCLWHIYIYIFFFNFGNMIIVLVFDFVVFPCLKFLFCCCWLFSSDRIIHLFFHSLQFPSHQRTTARQEHHHFNTNGRNKERGCFILRHFWREKGHFRRCGSLLTSNTGSRSPITPPPIFPPPFVSHPALKKSKVYTFLHNS